MAFVEPPKGRARITDLGNQITIEISMRPQNLGEWFVLVFLTVWLAVWLTVGLFAVAELIGLVKGSQPLHTALMIGWLAGWAAGGWVAGGIWLHFSFGRELLTVSADGLTVVTYPFGRLRKYWLANIRNLRACKAPYERILGWLWSGAIAFDYGAKTVHCGSMLDPAEARQIVRLIKERFGDRMAPDEEGD